MGRKARRLAGVRLAAEAHGRRSETLAAILLTLKFYRILGRRVKTPMGELDIVAKSPLGVLCFVEVKARSAENSAADSLGARQRGRIARAAELYLGTRPGLRHKGARFDATLVVPRRWPRHVKDAWRPDS
jgi:putative endonuclease